MSFLIRTLLFCVLASSALADASPKPVPGADNHAATFAERYMDNGDGTVTDKKTGLQWQRCSYGQVWQGNTCKGDAKQVQLFFFMKEESRLVPNREQGWRVPDSDELKSILYCRHGVIVDNEDHSKRMSVWLTSFDHGCDGLGFENTVPAIHPLAFPETPRPAFRSDRVGGEVDYCARDEAEDNDVREYYVSFGLGIPGAVEAGNVECYLRFVRANNQKKN